MLSDRDYSENLIIKSREGSSEAYQELLGHLYTLVQKFLIRKMGPFGAQDDVVQDCIIAIHKSFHTYRSEKPFLPWVYAVARYKAIDSYRKKQRKIEKELTMDHEAATFPQSASNSLIEAESAVENVSDYLGEALAQLPDAMRRAVELTKLEGLSIKEAAEKEQVSSAALRTRISRAYDILRRELERGTGE